MSEEITPAEGQGTDPSTPQPPTDYREYAAWRESGEQPQQEETAPVAPVDTEPQVKEASESEQESDDDEMIEVAGHKRRRPGQRERYLGRLEAENEYLRQGMAALQQPAPAGTPSQREEPPDPSQPKFEDYDDVVQYNIAVARWVYQKEEEARVQQHQQAAAWQHEQQLKAKWAAATESSYKAHPDYEQVVEAIPKVQGPVVNVIRQALLEEDNGPEILYYLGKHPDHVQKLLGMTPINATKEIGKLSVKLAGNNGSTPEPEKQKPVAAPQRLLPTVTRSGGSAPVSFTDPKVEGDWRTWAKMREAQLKGK